MDPAVFSDFIYLPIYVPSASVIENQLCDVIYLLAHLCSS